MSKITKKRKIETSDIEQPGIPYSKEAVCKLVNVITAFGLHDDEIQILQDIFTSQSPEHDWNANKDVISNILAPYSFGGHISFKQSNCFTDVINTDMSNVHAHMHYDKQTGSIHFKAMKQNICAVYVCCILLN